MAKPHQQTPKPTAPLTPIQQRLEPKPEAPVLTFVALGRTGDKRHVAALVKTQGLALVSTALLCHPTRDALPAEEAWRDAAYPVLFHGQAVPTTSGTAIVDGQGLTLVKTPSNKTAVVLLEIEDGKVSFREPNPRGMTREERLGSHLFEGTKLDAWQELDAYAMHHLLRETRLIGRRKTGA